MPKIDLILSKINITATEEEVIVFDTLPCSSIESLQEVEKTLMNPSTRNKLISYLQRLGGSSEKAVIRNIAKTVCTDETYMQHTWKSLIGGKTPFLLYGELNSSIRAAVRKNYPNLTEHTYVQFMQEHIKHAKFQIATKQKEKTNENTLNRTLPYNA